MAEIVAETHETVQPARRDFIIQAAQAFIGVGSKMAFWPFVDQMNPNQATSAREVKDVDLRPIRPGQTISVQWRGTPILIRNRPPEEVRIARRTLASELPDRFARNEALPPSAPADDANRTKEGYGNWLVVVGACTHMGCLLGPQQAHATVTTAEGWLCPCHAARFDLSGRVLSGPARTNLAVPLYQFLTPSRIRIG